MRTLSAALKDHFGGNALTLASLWTITRRDGVVIGYTDHDTDLTVGGMHYVSAPGFNRTSIQNSLDLTVDNLEIEIPFTDGHVTERDVRAGLYDSAAITLTACNFTNTSQSTMNLRTGWLGQWVISGGSCTVELRGMAQMLAMYVGENISILCRADFGDKRCKFDKASVTWQGTVATVAPTYFTGAYAAGAPPATLSYLQFGTVTWTSGPNTGFVMEIQNSGTGNDIYFYQPPPYPLSVGDGFAVAAGCDKTRATCATRWHNTVNLRAEPDVPGYARIFATPDFTGG
jgi:uncharacterized phage protein (TIGR02218 family)